MMPRVLFLHGLGGTSHGAKVLALQSKFGQEQVAAADFPFSGEALSRLLIRTLTFQNLNTLGSELKGMGAESERIALEACDAHHADILVGCSLGGVLAMRLAADRHLPVVLLTPVWNTQIKGDYLRHALGGNRPILRNYEHLMPLFDPFLLRWLQQVADIRVSDRVHPKTLILHSPEDELFDIQHSAKLLANSPLSDGDADTIFMKSVTDMLIQRGHKTDGRLVRVGENHKMDDPEALRALVDAVGLISGDYDKTGLWPSFFQEYSDD